MKRIVLVVTGILLLACSMAAAADTPAAPTGVQNSKKSAQAKMERAKKMQDLKKRAHAQREKAQHKTKGAAAQ